MCDTVSLKKQLHEGLALLRAGDLEESIQLAEQAVRTYPDAGAMWELLGVAYQKFGKPRLAVNALETATLLKPLDTGARFYLAKAYAATGSLDLAVFVFRMVSDDPKTPIWLLPKVATQLGEMHEFAHALGVCQLLVERDPKRHEAHFGIAFYMRRLGVQTDRIIRPISSAFQLAPRVPLYRVVLATLLHEIGQTAEALGILKGLRPEEMVQYPELRRRALLVFRSVNDAGPTRMRTRFPNHEDIAD